MGMAFVLIAAGLFLAHACSSSTRVVQSWKAPDVAARRPSKLLVVVPTRDRAFRQTAEEDLARRLPVMSVPSYTFISDAEVHDLRTHEQDIADRGFDGILVMRLVSVRREQSWIPGAYPGPTYAMGGWPVYTPGYVETDTKVRVDTNLYSLPNRELVWAATTQSFDPDSARDLVHDVAKAVSAKMEDDHVF